MYSLETRIKALAVAGMMAASVAGGAVTAFAAVDTGKVKNAVSVTKHVYYPAKGVTPTMPTGESSFGFTATFDNKSTLENNARGNAPEKFTGTLTPSGWTEGGSWTGTTTVTPESSFSWNNVTPGCYEYTLTENAAAEGVSLKDAYGFGWTFNEPTTTYRLRVYVKNNTNAATKENQPKVVEYTLIDNSDSHTAGSDDYDKNKVATASFSNIYTVRGGDKTTPPSGHEDDFEDPALTVSKTANGEYDDQTKYFDFYISFTYPTVADKEVKPTSNDDAAVDGILAKTGEGYVSVFKKVTEDTALGDYKFSLKNGEKIAFVNLPAGTTYTITEAADSQYKVSGMNVVSNGETKNDSGVSSAKVGTAYKVMNGEQILVGEKHNEINFTNTRDEITITGVVTHSAPFVIMVGALFVAVGGYVVLKKRIEE